MKTLNEVIKALEYCTGFDFVRCQDCPGYCEPDCGTQNDALHYLKELRHILDNTVFVNSTKEENGYWKLPTLPETGNDPLSWDDLKAMEGKPVWVETDNVKFWTVVDNFRTICDQECLCCSKGYMCRSTYARGDWQAYRKERK